MGTPEPRSFTYETDDPDDDLNFCPEGCGGRTEDPYGGPCKACWDKIGKEPRHDW